MKARFTGPGIYDEAYGARSGRHLMARIYQHQRLRSGRLCQQQRHTPICDIGVVEVRLKRFVFDEQSLCGAERAMRSFENFLKPANPAPHALCSGIAGAIGKPGRDIA